MVLARILPEEVGAVEGIVDVGIIVIAHFENPAQVSALKFLRRVLEVKSKCILPVSTFLGAYHIMTRYIGVEPIAAANTLNKTLETRSPALYGDIPIDVAIDALTYATMYSIESWDGYMIALAKAVNAPIIYSIDRDLAKGETGIKIVNPIPEKEFKAYNEWLRRRLLANK